MHPPASPLGSVLGSATRLGETFAACAWIATLAMNVACTAASDDGGGEGSIPSAGTHRGGSAGGSTSGEGGAMQMFEPACPSRDLTGAFTGSAKSSGFSDIQAVFDESGALLSVDGLACTPRVN
ncbi:MAG TPA: hypothetical protein VGQ57_18665, partial [Polyangiaceae bacterium]|nr:hypothetical protein [Polyangiaceae bacterium]